jgi:predicted flap endonuclease-1-like 5' DNA nuclease
MSSAFWLLLYLAPLLGLTAALFGWFGWRWRGSDLLKRVEELQNDAGNERENRAKAENERDALKSELQPALDAARRHEHDAAKARESLQALETESSRLLRDLELLRAERDQHAAALHTARAELAQLRAASASSVAASNEVPAAASPPPVEKPKRKRSTTAKAPKSASANATLGEKITAFEAQIASHQAAVAALTQEHDDWLRRVGKLEGKSPADPAGLALARRSLADSEKRLRDATTEIDQLQKQILVLHRAEEKAAALAAVPDDDLTRIKGIKKVINEQLRAHGIRTWRQIAQWDEEELRVFSELLAFKNRASREKWQEQARVLHEAAHGPLD